MNSETLMHQTEDGLTKIEKTFENDTVWLSIDQMTEGGFKSWKKFL